MKSKQNKILQKRYKTVLFFTIGILISLALFYYYTFVFETGEGLTKNSENGFFKYFIRISSLIMFVVQIILSMPFIKRSFRKYFTLIFNGFFLPTVILAFGLTYGYIYKGAYSEINDTIIENIIGLIMVSAFWVLFSLIYKAMK